MALLDPDDDFTGTDQKFAISFKQLSSASADGDKYTTTLTAADFRKATPITDYDRDSLAIWNGTTPYVWNYGYAAGFGYTDAADVNNARTPIVDVRHALRNDASIGQAMNKVHLRRSGDQLILTGQVSSEDLKDKVANKAEDVAKGWDVENHLTVQASPAE